MLVSKVRAQWAHNLSAPTRLATLPRSCCLSPASKPSGLSVSVVLGLVVLASRCTVSISGEECGLARTRRSAPSKYGRGSGTPHPVDIHVSKRIRMRRLYLDLNQQTLADALGLSFQQLQKYELGHNRTSALRLVTVAEVLGVAIAYFFNGLPGPEGQSTKDSAWQEQLAQPETIQLIRFYDAMQATTRKAFLALVNAVARSAG